MTRTEKRVLIISTWLSLSFSVTGVLVRDVRLWLLIVMAAAGLQLIIVMILLFAAMGRTYEEKH